MVSNELRRTISKKYDGNELTQLIGRLDQEKEQDLKALQRRVEEAAVSKTNVKLDA